MLTLLLATAAALAQPVPPQEPPSIQLVPPAGAPSPDTQPVPPNIESSESRPRRLQIGTSGLFQPGALVQAWFVDDSANGASTLSTFRIRRGEIWSRGEILPGLVSYVLMGDLAKIREPAATKLTTSDGSTVSVVQPTTALGPLQDAYITVATDYADVAVGQFKIPVSWEGYNPSSRTLFPERAPVSKQFGDIRDLGVRVAKTFEHVAYLATIVDGAGPDTFDTSPQKDAALRVEVYPVPGALIGGVVYRSIGYRLRPGTKDRYEGDLRVERGPYLVQSEVIDARDVGATGKPVPAFGFYAAAAYSFTVAGARGKFQPCARVGYLDPNTSIDLNPATSGGVDELWHWDLGLNYLVVGNELKYQVSYERQAFQNKPSGNEVIVAAQVWF
nr:porin [Kofleriaceae bacterium]